MTRKDKPQPEASPEINNKHMEVEYHQERNEMTISSQKEQSSSSSSSYSKVVTEEEEENSQEDGETQYTYTDSSEVQSQEMESEGGQSVNGAVVNGKGKNKQTAIEIDSTSGCVKQALKNTQYKQAAHVATKLEYVRTVSSKNKELPPENGDQELQEESKSADIQKFDFQEVNNDEFQDKMIPEQEETQKNGNPVSSSRNHFTNQQNNKNPQLIDPEISSIGSYSSVSTEKMLEPNHVQNQRPAYQNERSKVEQATLARLQTQRQNADAEQRKRQMAQGNKKYDRQLFNEILQYFKREDKRKQQERQHMKKIRQYEKAKQAKIEAERRSHIVPRTINTIATKEENLVKLTIPKINFSSAKQRQRFAMKRLVAKAFIRKGYGIENMKKELFETPDPIPFEECNYNKTLNGILTETFKRVEYFVQHHCGKKVAKVETKRIVSNLIEHQSEDNGTLTRFMRLIYKVDAGQTLVFSKQAVIEFYNHMIGIYYEKKGKYVPDKLKMNGSHGKLKPDDLSYDTQCQIMSYYIETQSCAGVKEKILLNYGLESTLADSKNIKNTLSRLWRQAIRKLKGITAQMRDLFDELGFLNELKGDRIKKILVSPEALEARVGLSELFIEDSMGVDQVKQLIASLEVAVYKMEKKSQKMYFDF